MDGTGKYGKFWVREFSYGTVPYGKFPVPWQHYKRPISLPEKRNSGFLRKLVQKRSQKNENHKILTESMLLHA
jgi:hypothetical protein